MKVDLHYGKGVVSLEIGDENIGEIIKPWSGQADSDNAALADQITASDQLAEFEAKITGKRLCVLLSDGTRDIPLDNILGLLLPRLRKCSQLKCLICTGTHNADTEANTRIKQKIEAEAVKADICNWRICVHDCQRADFVNAGQTSRRTNVNFNAEAEKAEIFLVLSDVKCHYFAGYSNPVKNFVPGICSFETTEQNHSLILEDNSTFGLHPWHSNPSRRSNPLADDQLEAMKLILAGRSVYAWVTISSSGKILWSGFGQAERICARAFDMADKMNTHTTRPTDRLIVSPGGLPNDVNLYIAQRAIEMTKTAVKDGGQILFLAACPDGVGEKHTHENFYNTLTLPIEQILKTVENRYKLFSHKPYNFAKIIKRLSRIYLYSEIPDDIIKAIHLNPVNQPQAIVNDWIEENPKVKITIVDGANKIALYTRRP